MKRCLGALQFGSGGTLGETLFTSVDEVGTQFLFDSEKLVVLGNSFGSARSTGLDETSLEGDGQVGDVDGLGFTGSVGGHDTPVTGLSELNAGMSSSQFRKLERSKSVTHAWIDSEIVPIWLIFNKRPLQAVFSMAVLIRKGLVTVKSVTGKISVSGRSRSTSRSATRTITDNLDLAASGELGPSLPVVLVEGVFDGDNGVLGNQVVVVLTEFFTGQPLGGVRVGVLRGMDQQVT